MEMDSDMIMSEHTRAVTQGEDQPWTDLASNNMDGDLVLSSYAHQFDQPHQMSLDHTHSHTRTQTHVQQHQHQQHHELRAPFKTGLWLPAEDERLRAAVAKYGARWVAVAARVGSRTGDQCAKRWNDNLNPDLDHSPWTPEEEERLLSLVEAYGNNWKFMASNFFETRAPQALRNRHSLIQRRLKRQGPGNSNGKIAAGPSSTSSTYLSTTATGSNTGDVASNADLITAMNATITARNNGQVATSNVQSDSCQALRLQLQAAGVDLNAKGPFVSACDAAKQLQQHSGDRYGGISNPTNISSMPTSETASAASLLSWDGHDFAGQQQHPLQLSALGMDLGGTNSNSGSSIPSTDGEIMRMVVSGDSSAAVTPVGSTASGGGPSSTNSTPSEIVYDDSRKSGDPRGQKSVEYSVTCQQGKLKALMCHLMDAALSETVAGGAAQGDPVTVTLQVKF